MWFFNIVLILSVIAAVSSLDLPSGIKPCKRTDTNCFTTAFDQFLKTFSEGSKEYGVPKFEPLLMKKIHINGNGGPVDVEQTYTNTNLHGLSTLTSKSITIKISDSECSILIKTHADVLKLIGTYTVKGKWLLINLNGGGASNLTILNADYDFDITCEVYDNGGQKYLKTKTFVLIISHPKLLIDYKNLIDNNPELSKTVLEALNEGSEDLFQYLKKDYEEVFGGAIKAVTDTFFKAVPLDKLFLD